MRRAILFTVDDTNGQPLIAEHNLLLSDALCEVKCRRDKGEDAYYAMQKQEHPHPDAGGCPVCSEILQNIPIAIFAH